MSEPLRPWRDQPPSTPEEAEAAALLAELRSVEPLSPAALARVERHVRGLAERRRRPWAPRLAAATAVVLAGFFGLFGLEAHRGLLGASADTLSGQTSRSAGTKSLREFGAEGSQEQAPPPAARAPSIDEAEALAASGRCTEVLGTFEALSAVPGELGERALFDRLGCERSLGRAGEAARSARDYLERFPGGPHAADVRRLLAP